MDKSHVITLVWMRNFFSYNFIWVLAIKLCLLIIKITDKLQQHNVQYVLLVDILVHFLIELLNQSNF